MAGEAQDVLSQMTVKELKALAADHAIDLGSARRKADIVGVLAGHPNIDGILGLPAVSVEHPPPPPDWEPPPPPEEPAPIPIEDIQDALASMTVKELRTLAKDQGINLKGLRRKADIVDAMAAAPNVHDVLREEILREQAAIEAMDETLEAVGEEAEAAIEEVIELPPMEAPGADEEIAQALNLDVDFGGAEDLLDQARMRFEEFNFDRAARLVDEALAIADISMGKFRRSALAYTLAATQRLVEEAARAGHDVDAVAKQLVSAKHSFADGTLLEDLDLLRDLQAATRSLYSKDMQRAREQIYEAQDLVADADGLGADVSRANDLLQQARNALERTDHAEAVQLAGEAKGAAEQARLARIEAIQGAIPMTQAVIQEAQNVGADVVEAERLLKQAEIALEAEDFVLVSELVRRAERTAMESQHYQIEKAMELRRRQVEKAHAMVESIEPTLIQGRRLGLDVARAEALLAKAREVLQDGDYVNGTMYAKEALELARQIEPQLEAKEIAAGVAKPTRGVCRDCRSRNLMFYDNGWGKCLNCGRAFQWHEPEKGLWGRLKDALRE